jgi:hypothetical protein
LFHLEKKFYNHLLLHLQLLKDLILPLLLLQLLNNQLVHPNQAHLL